MNKLYFEFFWEMVLSFGPYHFSTFMSFLKSACVSVRPLFYVHTWFLQVWQEELILEWRAIFSRQLPLLKWFISVFFHHSSCPFSNSLLLLLCLSSFMYGIRKNKSVLLKSASISALWRGPTDSSSSRLSVLSYWKSLPMQQSHSEDVDRDCNYMMQFADPGTLHQLERKFLV